MTKEVAVAGYGDNGAVIRFFVVHGSEEQFEKDQHFEEVVNEMETEGFQGPFWTCSENEPAWVFFNLRGVPFDSLLM